ncbi:uncharacterized protein [Palaemon carinicauda]|uniref:uncharacterized protein n=1 Tax=Palaemon carinicauda TaxID=392227 RepID=UPI0035B6381A
MEKAWLLELAAYLASRTVFEDGLPNETVTIGVTRREVERAVKRMKKCKPAGHVMRRDEHYIGRRVMEMEVQGTRRRGRPKRRLVDCIKDDLQSKGLTWDEVRDRGRCRKLTRNIGPT